MITYTAKLIDWDGASTVEIERAEAKFCDVLASLVGGRDQVGSVYRAWLEASMATDEVPPAQWSDEQRRTIEHFQRAVDKATAEALATLPGKGREPWFDLQMDSSN